MKSVLGLELELEKSTVGSPFCAIFIKEILKKLEIVHVPQDFIELFFPDVNICYVLHVGGTNDDEAQYLTKHIYNITRKIKQKY